MGYIYKIWNEKNKKVYIGQTSVGIKTRWSQHLSDFMIYNTKLYRSMRKYGAGIFHIEMIEECDNDILNEKEKYWIEYYDSYKHGYNSTLGGTALPSGNMPQRLNDKIIYQLWDEGNTISDIKEKTGYSDTAIREHLREYANFSVEESIHRGNIKSGKSRRKKICQWDLNGNLIQHYDSISQAAEIVGANIQNISKCLMGERITTKNYYWTYEGQLPNIKKKKLYQYDLQGNLIKIFNSKTEAAKELNIDSGSISKVCKGQRKTCGGFVWKEE